MERTNDYYFAKEFKGMLQQRRVHCPSFSVYDLPLPAELEQHAHQLQDRKFALVTNVNERFFERLNNTEVEIIGRQTFQRRQVLSDGSYRRDEKGEYVLEHVPIPQQSVAVLSSLSIGLVTYEEDATGNRKYHRVSEGFGYVDYKDTPQGRKYLYYLPKTFVENLNINALVVTSNKKRTHYGGLQLALTNGHTVYLYVLPYTARDYADMRIISLAPEVDFEEKVDIVLETWINAEVIFHPSDTFLDDPQQGVDNLGLIPINNTLDIYSYRRAETELPKADALAVWESFG